MRPYILAEQNHAFIRDQRWEVAVLPFGATEPHNLHMPYGTDNYQVEEIGRRACESAYNAGAKVLLFAHGHLLRVLAARWLGQSPTSGRFFMLGTATLSVLGWERGGAAVERWNVPSGPAPGSGPARGPR